MEEYGGAEAFGLLALQKLTERKDMGGGGTGLAKMFCAPTNVLVFLVHMISEKEKQNFEAP